MCAKCLSNYTNSRLLDIAVAAIHKSFSGMLIPFKINSFFTFPYVSLVSKSISKTVNSEKKSLKSFIFSSDLVDLKAP